MDFGFNLMSSENRRFKFYPFSAPKTAAGGTGSGGGSGDDGKNSRLVIVIDQDGNSLGIMDLSVAQQKATELGLMLFLTNLPTDPPTAKLMEYGKYKYELNKGLGEFNKPKKMKSIKRFHIKFNIDQHDLQSKLKQMEELLQRGSELDLQIMFDKKSESSLDAAGALLDQIIEQLTGVGAVDDYVLLKEDTIEAKITQ